MSTLIRSCGDALAWPRHPTVLQHALLAWLLTAGLLLTGVYLLASSYQPAWPDSAFAPRVPSWMQLAVLGAGTLALTGPFAWLMFRRQLSREYELEQLIVHHPDHLDLHFQPVYDMRTESCVGADCLLRLRSLKGRAIAPEHVLAILANEPHLQRLLTRKVLTKSMTYLAGWLRIDPLRFLSVNVNAADLEDRDLTAWLAHEMADIGIRPAQLHLDVRSPEDGTFSGTAALNAEAVRRAGVKLWLDGFRPGVDNLANLLGLPLDGVKLDRSVVEGLDRDDDSGFGDVQVFLSDAQALGLRVAAEGVSNAPALAALRTLKFRLQQGNLLAKPEPLSSFLSAESVALSPKMRRRIEAMSRWPYSSLPPLGAADRSTADTRPPDAGDFAPKH